MKFLQESGFGIRLTLLSASVLLAGLLASFLTAKHIKADTDVETKHLLKITCAEIERAIEGRFDLHERILSSAVAFFQSSEGVTRQRWQQFVGYQKFDQHLPGIQGVGFASLVPRDKLEQHIKEIRAEGFPEYTVRPAGERALYSSIIYLEPFSGRNLRAFGYDMLTEPIRLAALERARDLNAPTLSGKVRLVQETAQDVQAGTLMFLPVYQHGMPTETVDQRRSAIRGWIYSPYRMGDLMQGILEKVSPETINRIRVRIFDGDTITPEALLYDSQPDPDNQAAAVASLSAQHRVIISGRPWTLYFTMPYIPHGDRAWLVGVSGGIISLLVTGLILASTLLAARFKGEQMVRRSTQEMLEKEMRWKSAIEGHGDGLWEWDVPEEKVFFSDRLKQMLNLTDAEAGNSIVDWQKRIHPGDLPHVMATIKAHFDGQTATFADEHRLSCKDGSWKWTSARGVVVDRDAAGNPLRFIGTYIDITARKQAEEKTKLQLDELKRWYGVMLEREGRILEVKKEVNKLLVQLGQPPRYPTALDEHAKTAGGGRVSSD